MSRFQVHSLLLALVLAATAHAQPDSNHTSLTAINLTSINSDAQEYGPLLSNDGSTFYFSREMDLFLGRVNKFFQASVLPNGSMSAPVEIERFNKLKDFGCATIDNAGEIFCCYNPRPGAGGSIDIFQLKGNDLIPLDSVNSKYWDTQPSVSSDGKSLFFASERERSSKWSNIFVAHRSGPQGSWSTPIKLGPQINGGEYNCYPSISRDGKVLFFGSNRNHTGSLLYASVRNGESDTSWSEPMVLPPPINAYAENSFPYLSPSGKDFFFVSNRKGGVGRKDIYQVHLPNGVEDLLGKH